MVNLFQGKTKTLRLTIYISTILLATLLLGFELLTNPVHITGHLNITKTENLIRKI